MRALCSRGLCFGGAGSSACKREGLDSKRGAWTLTLDECVKKQKVCCESVVQGQDASYWHQVSITLCGENELLRRELDIKADSYRVLQESHVRLSSAYQKLHAMVLGARRDNVILRHRAIPGKHLPPVPSNTQGKDVAFWHQCARTLQRQYQEVCVQLEQVCAGLSDDGN